MKKLFLNAQDRDVKVKLIREGGIEEDHIVEKNGFFFYDSECSVSVTHYNDEAASLDAMIAQVVVTPKI